MNYHPDVLAAHAEFGGDLQAMQALYDRPDHVARIAALEAQLAERVKARSEPVQVYIDHADHTITTNLKDAIEDMKGFLAQGWDLHTEAHFMLALSALESIPSAPKVTDHRKIDGVIRGLDRIKSDFKMRGSNATTIDRAIQALRAAAQEGKE